MINKAYTNTNTKVKIYNFSLFSLYRLTKIIQGIRRKGWWHHNRVSRRERWKQSLQHVTKTWPITLKDMWLVTSLISDGSFQSVFSGSNINRNSTKVILWTSLGCAVSRSCGCFQKSISAVCVYLSFILIAFFTTGIWLAGGGPSSINSFSGSCKKKRNQN